MQIAVAEANLRQLPAEGKDFLQFTKEFRNLLKVAKDLGSSISNGQVVATYLKALLGTPLERKVLSLLDDPHSGEFPDTIDKAVAIMTGVWRTELTRNSLQRSQQHTSEPMMVAASASGRDRKCVVCKKNNHCTEDCRILLKALDSGVIGKLKQMPSVAPTKKEENGDHVHRGKKAQQEEGSS
jgi:hypothetical protein